MKICTVIGARPQFIKAAAVSAEIAQRASIEEVIIHTGQHYDPEMSQIFFEELNIPRAKYNLNIGSGSHGNQTGRMLSAIEEVLITEKPDWVLIYGDTNSTLAGAIASVKLHIPVAHVEAGMRSFNRKMPEEINRIIADHTCELNLCSTKTAVENLHAEGRAHTAALVGDVMYDCALKFAEVAEKHCKPLEKIGLTNSAFILMTCHRAENTDSKERLTAIVDAVNTISKKHTIVYPVHPRTKDYLQKYGLVFSDNVQLLSPLSYLEMIILERAAALILTDSGGVQKEAFFYQVPCVTMRDETEWTETVQLKWNVITGANKLNIIEAVESFLANNPPCPAENPYGNGNAASKILDQMQKRVTNV